MITLKNDTLLVSTFYGRILRTGTVEQSETVTVRLISK